MADQFRGAFPDLSLDLSPFEVVVARRLHSAKGTVAAETLVEPHGFQAWWVETVVVPEMVLVYERLHALVDALAVGHVTDGSPEEGADAAQGVSAMEGALRCSKPCADAEEDADGAGGVGQFTANGVAVAVLAVRGLPDSLWVLVPRLVPCPATRVVGLQGPVHVYVAVDVGFLEEAWSGGGCSSCVADVDSLGIAGIEPSTQCLLVVAGREVRGEGVQFVLLSFALLDGEHCPNSK